MVAGSGGGAFECQPHPSKPHPQHPCLKCQSVVVDAISLGWLKIFRPSHCSCLMPTASQVAKDSLQRATSLRPAAHSNSDTEDEGSPTDKEQRAQTAELPSFAKDAPDLPNWLFAKLLVSPIDIMAHKKRGSRNDKPRKNSSCRPH